MLLAFPSLGEVFALVFSAPHGLMPPGSRSGAPAIHPQISPKSQKKESGS